MLRYAAGTKSSRLTTARSDSTPASRTSQGRICCSIMLKRACSVFMASSRKGRRGGQENGEPKILGAAHRARLRCRGFWVSDELALEPTGEIVQITINDRHDNQCQQ